MKEEPKKSQPASCISENCTTAACTSQSCTSGMRYAQLREMDVSNGPGIRVSVFVTGCTHRCPGCFNALYQDPQFGLPWTEETTQTLLKALESDMISGLTVLGGEPMQNLGLIPVLETVRRELPNKSIWLYSGYTWEEIQENSQRRDLLALCDVLVDGRYVEGLRNLKLAFRGSSNQRILDVLQSQKKGKPVWLAGYEAE